MDGSAVKDTHSWIQFPKWQFIAILSSSSLYGRYMHINSCRNVNIKINLFFVVFYYLKTRSHDIALGVLEFTM